MAATTKSELVAQVRRLRKSLAHEKGKSAALAKSRKEAFEQRAATAEILQVISRSPADAQPVFDAIVKRSLRLIGGHSAAVWRYAEGMLHLGAYTSTSKAGDATLRKSYPRPLSQAPFYSRAFRTKAPYFVADTEKAPLAFRRMKEMGRARGYRSTAVVPMLCRGAVIGGITVTRREPGPFDGHQIALLKTFADQAVIAIENVRRFNETKEALEHQKASADILRVISSSPTDLSPVMEALAESAARLCEATDAHVWQRQGDELQAVASHGELRLGRSRLRIGRDSVTGRAAFDCELVHVHDLAAVWKKEFPDSKGMAKGGSRSVLAVPLVREGAAIGAILIRRTEVRPFTSKQLALLQTFADQAVIAIENVRLFKELESRNRDLAEALEQQTATGEILKVISSSPTDTQPVFDIIARNALELCGSLYAIVQRFDGELIHFASSYHVDSEQLERVARGYPRPPDNSRAGGRTILSKSVVRIEDTRADPEYESPASASGGWRRILAVPMLRDGDPLGAIVVGWAEPGPIPKVQEDLLKTFADQAVIAIENVRLFNETKDALERQTATAEILKVIASSPADIQPVLDAVGENAARLCEANNAVIFRLEGDLLRQVAAYGGMPTSSHPTEGLRVNRGRVTGRAVFDRRTIHVHDLAGETSDFPEGSSDAKRDGHRTTLATPLLREGAPIGAILIRRMEVRPFSDKQIALLQTFADQAVIAIENVRLFNETKEALGRQTATAEILKVIASSPSDVQPVFDAIAASARRLLGGHAALVAQRAGDMLELAAFTSTGEAGDSEMRRLWPSRITGKGHMGKALVSAAPAWVEDIETDPSYSDEFRAGARARGMRSSVSVPMLREGEAIGVISVNRSIPGRFSDHQTNLLKTFADQALIAIENVRLFNETQEALARQAAAAQVLRSISESVSDTAPVFTAILDCCNRLIPSIDYVQVQLIEGSDRVRLIDHRFGQVRGAAPGKQDERRAELMAREATHFPRPLAGSTLERALNQGRVVILADTLDGPDTPPGTLVEARRWGHSYSQITVPLMREGRCIGAIEAFRRQLGGFEAKESSLLESFADQAVIAIENVRMFNETKEALERQTATADILKVISSSPRDLQPVFEAILDKATHLCEAHLGFLGLYDGEEYEHVAQRGANEEFAKWLGRGPFVLDPRTTVWQMLSERKPIHHRDVRESAAYREGVEATVKSVELGGARSWLAVPMLKEDRVVGGIVIYRPEVRPFAQKQIDLVATFASQAVIAIENVRLFKELETRTQALGQSVDKLTALGEVGQAISSTLDLETVLKTIASHAVQLTGLDGASIYEYDEAAAEFRLQVAHNFAPEFLQAIRNAPIRRGDGTVGGVAITLEPAQVTDILEGGYHSSRKELLVGAGYRAILTVPLLREGHIIGALNVLRKTPGPFADEIVELLKTFATQSAMAIQNARLFREIAEKGKQLEEASQHKSQFLASMSHELRTPLNALLGFNEMILGDVYGEVPGDMQPPLAQMQSSGRHLLRLINNVLDLAKIEAGRMELALSDYSVQDTVSSVHSTLSGLAADKGLEFLASVPADIPLAYGDPGRISQCLMNLAGNSLKFTKVGKVEISVVENGGLLIYRVADTGIGIPTEKIESLFTEFKQTDATVASEYGGTGLGLSISKKFVEMHGGRIWVESAPGEGSTFIFEIPLRVAE